MIANCGCDERGLASGGQAGDQTGSEWAIVPWYSFPWQFVLHHPDPVVRQTIAILAIEAANNNKIGYDQSERTTFWIQLQKCGYHPKNIKTACETDCSAGVAAIVKAAGYILNDSKLKSISPDSYTGNLRSRLMAAGFECRNGSKYLNTDDYCNMGDIPLHEYYHTTIITTDGKYAGRSESYHTLKIRTIYNGCKGHDVFVLQCILKARTFYKGKITGHFDDALETALIKAQKKLGLEADGVCGILTWSALLALEYLGTADGYYLFAIKVTKKDTDKTDSALLMQEMLKIKKFYTDKLDGIYRTNTIAAVKAFQKKYGLPVTGECDVVTIEKIMTPSGQLKPVA